MPIRWAVRMSMSIPGEPNAPAKKASRTKKNPDVAQEFISLCGRTSTERLIITLTVAYFAIFLFTYLMVRNFVGRIAAFSY